MNVYLYADTCIHIQPTNIILLFEKKSFETALQCAEFSKEIPASAPTKISGSQIFTRFLKLYQICLNP